MTSQDGSLCATCLLLLDDRACEGCTLAIKDVRVPNCSSTCLQADSMHSCGCVHVLCPSPMRRLSTTCLVPAKVTQCDIVQLTLEAKFGQRVKEKSHRTITEVHRACMHAARHYSMDAAPMDALAEVLSVWGFDLEESDKELMRQRYGSSNGVDSRLPYCACV